jgi:hypothetical protein
MDGVHAESRKDQMARGTKETGQRPSIGCVYKCLRVTTVPLLCSVSRQLRWRRAVESSRQEVECLRHKVCHDGTKPLARP